MEPAEVAHYEPLQLDLYCLQIQLFLAHLHDSTGSYCYHSDVIF